MAGWQDGRTSDAPVMGLVFGGCCRTRGVCMVAAKLLEVPATPPPPPQSLDLPTVALAWRVCIYNVWPGTWEDSVRLKSPMTAGGLLRNHLFFGVP